MGAGFFFSFEKLETKAFLFKTSDTMRATAGFAGCAGPAQVPLGGKAGFFSCPPARSVADTPGKYGLPGKVRSAAKAWPAFWGPESALTIHNKQTGSANSHFLVFSPTPGGRRHLLSWSEILCPLVSLALLRPVRATVPGVTRDFLRP